MNAWRTTPWNPKARDHRGDGPEQQDKRGCPPSALPGTPIRRRAGEGAAPATMRIAQVAPLWERVPPALYGGTERVVALLTDELVRRGHRVTLFASGDSVTRAELVAPTARALRLDPAGWHPMAAHMLELGDVFERADDFDLIHCHVDYLAFPFARLVRTPTIHTLHGRLDLPYLPPVFRRFRGVPLVSISQAQREPLRGLGLAWAATVYHGLPLDRFPYSPREGRYLAFLGRIAPEKRPDLAIAIAKRVGLPLKIAAKVDPADREYFETEIRHLLDHPLIEFIGEIDDAAKPAFLGDALALLFPVDWPEPFGLAMIEAMACGTPVVARPCGSVPEIVRPGTTGFIADTLDELVDVVKRLDTIDRAECRRHVEARFTVERMVAEYEAAYRRLVQRTEAA
jgi:glycosyltransferase involved in cell wall biosynthesis